MRYAAVAELADAQDLKSCGTNLPYRFDSGLRHLYEVLQTLVSKGVEAFFVLRRSCTSLFGFSFANFPETLTG